MKLIFSSTMLLLSTIAFGQSFNSRNESFYQQLITVNYNQLKHIIKARADSTRNLYLQHRQVNQDAVILNGLPLAVSYSDSLSFNEFKKVIDGADIRTIGFYNNNIGTEQQPYWVSLIVINSIAQTNNLFMFSPEGFSIRFPAFSSYKCIIRDSEGKQVKKLMDQFPFHAPLTLRTMSKDFIGVNNIVAVYINGVNSIETVLYKN